MTEPAADLPYEAYEAAKDPANRVDHYVKIEQIGSGGMSTVWRAWDTKLRIEVALKFLNAHQSEELRIHGEREGRVTARVQDPAVPRVYTQGEHGGQVYLAMQLIRGVTLDKYRPADAREAATLVRDVARAVHKAHEQGVVHRDISPSNIMVEGRQPYLLDFGIAHLAEERLTTPGAVLGRRRWASPEQLDNRIDARSDVYALGATLLFAATGRPPFDSVADDALIDAVRHVDPDPRGAPRDLATIVLVAMDKDPARRYPTAAAFADALDRFLRGEEVGPRPSRLRAVVRRIRRRPVPLIVLAAAALVGLVAWRESERARESWSLLYSLDADPGGARWRVTSGSMRVENGAMVLDVPSATAVAILDHGSPGDVRIEYTAEVRSDSPGVSDASCFFGAVDDQITTGTFVGVGSDFNTRAKVVCRHRLVAVRPGVRLERSRPVRVAAQRDERGVRLWLDGELVLEYDDLLPVGHDAANVGVYSVSSVVTLRDLRIYTRQLPERTVKSRLADRLFGAGDYASAERAYAELLDAGRTEELEYKHAVAGVRRNPKSAPARHVLARLRSSADPAIAHQAARALAAASDPEEAVEIVAASLPGDAGRRFALMAVLDEQYDELRRTRRWDEAVAVAERIMGRLRSEAVATLGTSNFANNIPLAWARILIARGRREEAVQLLTELEAVARGNPDLVLEVAIVLAAVAPDRGDVVRRTRAHIEELEAGADTLWKCRSQVLELEGKPDAAREVLRVHGMAAPGPGGPGLAERVLARLGEPASAWAEVAAADEGVWRPFFAGRLSTAAFVDRLALTEPMWTWNGAFWEGVRHELHGRKAEAREAYARALAAGLDSRLQAVASRR